MKRLLGATIAVWAFSLESIALAGEPPPPPQVLFEDLYVDVELQRIFPDSKEFADATAKFPPPEILARYRARKPNSRESLKSFVEANFDLPVDAAAPVASATRLPLRQHIDALWDRLTRFAPTAAPYSSLLPLPKPYVVPGGRFREIYYWDSYFTMLGLAESGRRDLLEDMLEDFAFVIDAYGHAPNGARSYYLTRSQPPVFFAMVGLLSPADAAAAYARYLPQLQREYSYWMDGEKELSAAGAHRRVVALDDGSVLNRYWDDSDAPRDKSYLEDVETAQAAKREPHQLYREIRAAAESGWDFSSRWFSDRRTLAAIDTSEIVPVDLNSLLYGLEGAIRDGCERTGNRDCAAEFARRAAARRAAFDRFLWDPDRGVYLDYNWTQKRQPRRRQRRHSLSALRPRFERGAGGVRRRSRRARFAEARRDRNDRHRHGPAMGRAQRLGAAAMDCCRRVEPLWAPCAGRSDRLPLVGQCLAGLPADRQAPGEIRRDVDRSARRRRRVSDTGRLWLDQWRYAQVDGALSRRRGSRERRGVPGRKGVRRRPATIVADA